MIFLLFQKIEDEEIEAQIQKLQKTKEMNQAETPQTAPIISPEISFDDFTKLDLRVATILEAERVPKTDKLLKLKVDLGFEQRTVVSGIAGSYAPENIIGQQVTLLVNLAPRKIKGIESQGMILMGEDEKGNLKFISPSESINAGCKIG